MTSIEIYDQDQRFFRKVLSPVMFRVNEHVSIQTDGLFTNYRITKVWHSIAEDENGCVPCVEVTLDD